MSTEYRGDFCPQDRLDPPEDRYFPRTAMRRPVKRSLHPSKGLARTAEVPPKLEEEGPDDVPF